ncbi:hypothetical protein [Modicisalibacter luteus]
MNGVRIRHLAVIEADYGASKAWLHYVGHGLARRATLAIGRYSTFVHKD